MQHAVVVLGIGVASALSGVAGVAHASESGPSRTQKTEAPRVVLVASPGMEDLVVRFVAEMHSLRLDVVRAPDAVTAPDALELGRLAQEHRARVAVRVSRAGSALGLWLVNAQSQELVYRRVAAEGDPAVLVLRSLEILRGTLIDLGMAVDPREPPAFPRPAIPPIEKEPEPLPTKSPLWLGVSGGLFAPRAASSFAAVGGLSLERRLGARFALCAEVLAPLSAWGVSGEGGRATIRLGSATVAGLVKPWGARTVSPALGLGVGALALRVQGEAEVGFRGRSLFAFAFFPHARAELGVEVTPRLRVRAAFAAGLATPRPVLLFGAEREESWLNPILVSTLGIEIPLP